MPRSDSETGAGGLSWGSPTWAVLFSSRVCAFLISNRGGGVHAANEASDGDGGRSVSVAAPEAGAGAGAAGGGALGGDEWAGAGWAARLRAGGGMLAVVVAVGRSARS